MTPRFFAGLFLLLAPLQPASGQTAWGTQGQYITKDGRPIYLNGVNYTVPDGWMLNLPNLSKGSVDADMAALEALGVNHIRFFPLWPLTQPAPDRLDDKVMKQIDMVSEGVRSHGMSMQISPITGWMSGAVLLPPWAVGDLFRDPKILEGEKFLCRAMAARYRNNPAVLGYDFGNETNVLAERLSLDVTRGQIFEWMKALYSSFAGPSRNKLITDGIGTGYGSAFDIRDIAQTADYLAPHSYAFFHGTVSLDPWYGQRNSYSSNFIISWCKMARKPVVLQEFGTSEGWLPASKIGANIRLNYISTWADGAAGFIWWGSHDIDTAYRLVSKDLQTRYSIPSFARGEFDLQEYHTGLLTTRNIPKEYASSYAQSIRTVNELGLSWAEELPVCYILVPGDVSFNQAMHKLITAYSLAKQVHFDVKLCYEGEPIPPDAAAVIIPGLKLTGKAVEAVATYLNGGGKVYQSYENDFGTAIAAGDHGIVPTPSLIVNQPVGGMEVALPMHIPGRISFRKVLSREPATPLVSFAGEESRPFTQTPEPGEGVFFSEPVGKGTFYYFAGDLESDLAEAYDPWPETNCELFYSAVRPQTSIDIDNKYVELHVKSNGGRRIVMLLNHSEKYQNVTVKSDNAIALGNHETKERIGAGREISLLLRPAEVVIADVEYSAGK